MSDFANTSVEGSNCEKVETLMSTTRRFLFELGFKCNLRGTRYLIETIAGQYLSGEYGKDLYSAVAKYHNTTYGNVARCIRTAIVDCHCNGALSRLNEVTGTRIINSKYPPSNSEFIFAMCTWLQILYGEKPL